MKRIGIYFFCVIAIGCITSSILFWENDKSGEISVERSSEEQLKRSSIENEPLAEVSDQITILSEDNISTKNVTSRRFLAKEEGGYLVIYDCITMERYDDTAILVKNLPVRLQEELEKGLFFTNEEALYEFLENYSS